MNEFMEEMIVTKSNHEAELLKKIEELEKHKQIKNEALKKCEDRIVKLTKALDKACNHISKFEEPLCTLKECNDQYKSCSQCEHSVYTKEEWKEWFLSNEM